VFVDSYLEDNQTYYYSVASVTAGGYEGDKSVPVHKTAHYAVLLVHGVCSDSTAWDTYKDLLRNNGFTVYTISLTPNDARPQDVVGQLEARIASIPGAKINVVAHSMGGLVTREYIARQVDSHRPVRVNRLITLGTPHHGSDGATWLVDHPLIRGILGCPMNSPAYMDLVPGSNFLNGLNYGAGPGEPYRVSTSEPRSSESLRDPSVQIFTVAGTGEVCSFLNPLTRPAWTSPNGDHMPNDGVVSTFSANLTNPAATGWDDVNLGVGALTHCACFPGVFCWQHYTQSVALEALVDGLLQGQVPASAPLLAQAPQGVEGAQTEPTLAELPAPSGTLAPGATQESAFVVPATTLLQAGLFAASPLQLKLRTPSNQVLTAADTVSVPGLTYLGDGAGNACFVVNNPVPGTWGFIVDGTASSQAVAFAGIIQIANTRLLHLDLTSSEITAGDSLGVKAWIADNGVPLPGVSWNSTLTRPDLTNAAFTLHDDGAHGDAGPNDGIFGVFLKGTASGTYSIQVTGTPPGGGINDARTGGATFEVTKLSDLMIGQDGVRFGSPVVNPGQQVMVYAIVKNSGTTPANGVRVEFWDGDPGVQFGSASVNFAPGETKPVGVSWTAAAPDTHEIRVTVSPFSLAAEQDYTNNSASALVVLGQAVTDAPTTDSRPLFSLGVGSPNPFTDGVTFRFSLAATGPATLQVFDVQGRLVRDWHWEALRSGQNAVRWDGRTRTGSRCSSGVYFYKLTSSGQSLTKKVVRLR
jgi:pimeloyl-ACP methyl ester carboxylesterase